MSALPQDLAPPTQSGGNNIRKISSSRVVTTLAGSITGTSGYADGLGTNALFMCSPVCQIAVVADTLYVTERSSNRIRRITSAGGVSTVAGSGSIGSSDGIGTAASFNQPLGIAVSPDGSILFVGDSQNLKVRRISIATLTTGKEFSICLLDKQYCI